MTKIHILDVTLRDGGLRNNNDFGEQVSADVVSTLDEIGVDFVEFTLRIPTPKALNLNGENEFLTFIRKKAPRAKLAVMCVPAYLKDHELAEMKACEMDLIRFALLPEMDQTDSLKKIAIAKSVGLMVSANFTSVTQWHEKEFLELVSKLIAIGVDIIYLADSCGSMTPTNVEKYFHLVKSLNPPHMGFHAHDNIGMALLNSITAMQCGADFIDCSLRGMGNSSGNLKTETLLIYLNKMKNCNFDIKKLLNFCDEFEKKVPQSHPLHTPAQMFMGALDLQESFTHLEKIQAIAEAKKINWFEAALLFKMNS